MTDTTGMTRRAAGTVPDVSTQLPDWPAVTDTVLDLGDRTVRILRAEGRSGGEAEPQLLVHGLGGSAVGWVQVMEGLAERGPVVALDLPGFGRTPVAGDDPLSVPGHRDLVLAVADALGWERFTLHGNSMGGLIGIMIAAEQPGRLQRLVLVSPALPPRSPLGLLVPSRASLDALVPVAVSSATALALGAVGLGGPELDRRKTHAMLRLIFPDPDEIDPALLALMAADFADDGETEGADRRRAMLAATGSITRLWADPRRLWRAVHQVDVPTLVVGGTRDALVPAKVLRAVLRARPDWRGHVLDDRRHVLMLEDPQGYLDLVGRWHDELAA